MQSIIFNYNKKEQANEILEQMLYNGLIFHEVLELIIEDKKMIIKTDHKKTIEQLKIYQKEWSKEK